MLPRHNEVPAHYIHLSMSLGFVRHRNTHFANMDKPFFIGMIMIRELSVVQSSHLFVMDDQAHLLYHHRWHCCTADRLTDSTLMCQSWSTDCGVTPNLCICWKSCGSRLAVKQPILKRYKTNRTLCSFICSLCVELNSSHFVTRSCSKIIYDILI